MALAQRKTQTKNITPDEFLNTPPTHYEMFTEQLKNARIDRLEEVLTERIKSTNERIDATRNELTEKINSTNERIDATRNELNTRIDALDEKMTEKIKSTNSRMTLFFTLMLAFMSIGFGVISAMLGVMLSKMM